MATIVSGIPMLADGDKDRLRVLLGSISSHTLLRVLRDMERENDDARLIVEVLLERSAGDASAIHQAPVIPR